MLVLLISHYVLVFLAHLQNTLFRWIDTYLLDRVSIFQRFSYPHIVLSVTTPAGCSKENATHWVEGTHWQYPTLLVVFMFLVDRSGTMAIYRLHQEQWRSTGSLVHHAVPKWGVLYCICILGWEVGHNVPCCLRYKLYPRLPFLQWDPWGGRGGIRRSNCACPWWWHYTWPCLLDLHTVGSDICCFLS